MRDDVTQAIIHHKITTDLVLDMYEEYKQMEEGDEKEAVMAVIKLMSKNIGDYLVLSEQSN